MLVKGATDIDQKQVRWIVVTIASLPLYEESSAAKIILDVNNGILWILAMFIPLFFLEFYRYNLKRVIFLLKNPSRQYCGYKLANSHALTMK